MNSLRLMALTLGAVLLAFAPVRNLAQTASGSTNGATAEQQRARESEVTARDLAELEREIQRLAELLQSAPEANSETGLKTRLMDRLERYFDREIERREEQLGKLERRVQSLRQQLERRQAAKEQILAQQMKGLMAKHRAQRKARPGATAAAQLSGEDAALSIARDQERRLAWIEGVPRLRKLVLGMLIYAEEHDGSFPPNLSEIPGQLVDDATDKTELIYLRVSDEILSGLRQTLAGLQPSELAWMPISDVRGRAVILLPLQHLTLVAHADGSVRQEQKSHTQILKDQLKFLATHHPDIKVSVAAGSAFPLRHVVSLREALDEIGIKFTNLKPDEQDKVAGHHAIDPKSLLIRID